MCVAVLVLPGSQLWRRNGDKERLDVRKTADDTGVSGSWSFFSSSSPPPSTSPPLSPPPPQMYVRKKYYNHSPVKNEHVTGHMQHTQHIVQTVTTNTNVLTLK